MSQMRGLYFEEFEVGRVYRHAFRRTVTEPDNVLFTSLTMNVAPIHLDHEHAATTIHGRPLVNSLFTVALIGAFHVPDLTMGTTLGNLGYDEVRFPAPVFHGDTLRGETTVVDKRLGHRVVRASWVQPARRPGDDLPPGGSDDDSATGGDSVVWRVTRVLQQPQRGVTPCGRCRRRREHCARRPRGRCPERVRCPASSGCRRR